MQPVNSPLESPHCRLCPKSRYPSKFSLSHSLTSMFSLTSSLTCKFSLTTQFLKLPLLPSGSCFNFLSSKSLFRFYPTARELVFLQIILKVLLLKIYLT